MQILRSLSLNSYGTFQPRGPNLHRSMMEAWKKQREYNRYLNAWGWAEDSNHSSSNVKYEPIKEARMPLGGSLVILMELCSTGTGNAWHGSVVNHNRNSWWVVSGVMFSTILSNDGSQEIDKWQFCKHTHPPLSMATDTAFDANGPWRKNWCGQEKTLMLSGKKQQCSQETVVRK